MANFHLVRLSFVRNLLAATAGSTLTVMSFVVLLNFSGSLSLCLAQSDSKVEKANLDFFENRIRPLLIEECISCHGPKKSEAGLRVDRLDRILKGGESGPAMVPSSPNDSLILKAVRHDGDLQMPPDKKLTAEQIEDLERWIASGSPWPKDMKLGDGPELRVGPITDSERQHWAFQPPREPNLPKQTASDRSKAIDSLVELKQRELGLTKRKPASKEVLLRRATYDLTGLPPTKEELHAFIADQSPDAFAKVIERLLSSKAYGEQWGRHWLDVVHYADTAGETADYPTPLAYKYRNWVVSAINGDMPYDRFLQLQLAGDLLAKKESVSDAEYEQMLIATGFIAISRRFGFDVENYHNLTIQDTIDTVGQSVLGLTLGCARCHDHKFDPVNMSDYYGWYGIFESTRYSFPGSEEKKRPYDLYSPLPPEKASLREAEQNGKLASLESDIKSIEESRKSIEEKLSLNLGSDGYVGFENETLGGNPSKPYNFLMSALIQSEAQSPFTNAFLPGSRGIAFPSSNDNDAFGRPLDKPFTPANAPLLYYNIDFRNRSVLQDGKGSYRFYVGHGPGNSGAMELAASASTLFAKNGPNYEPIASLELGKWYNIQVRLDLHAKTYRVTLSDGLQNLADETKGFTNGWDGVVDYTFVDKYGNIDGVHPEHDIDNVSLRTIPHLPAHQSLLQCPKSRAMERWERFVEKSRLPTPVANPDNHVGLMSWHGNPLPQVAVNTSEETLKVPGTVEPKRLVVHPQEKDGVAIGWRSPGTMRVQIRGKASSVHDCGDSIEWYIDKIDGRGFHAIGKGVVERNGSQQFVGRESNPPTNIEVNEGDFLQLVVLPKTHYGCDLTQIEWTITDLESGKSWDLVTDVVSDLLASNPHQDSRGNRAVWYFFQIPPDRGESIASQPIDIEPGQLANWIQEMAQANSRISELQKEREIILKAKAEDAKRRIYGAIDRNEVGDAKIQLRGEKTKLGDIAVRGNLDILGKDQLEDKSSSGRLEMAKWLTRPSNPLTARVMVNRIWQHHFGRGIVGTENDFGVRGIPPTHPELLDWLAIRFVESGWSMKSMHRLIMNSEVYKQSSNFDAACAEKDPDAKYLWRFNPRRLSAEELRDSMLKVSGLLDRTVGEEHPFPPVDTWGFSQHAPFYGVYPTNQRSIYLMQQRLKRHPYLSLFDGADPNASTARRELTTVPTQALFLMNSDFIHEQANALGARIAQTFSSSDLQVEELYQATLQRSPTEEERSKGIRFLNGYSAKPDEALAALARVMLVRNEFLFVE